MTDLPPELQGIPELNGHVTVSEQETVGVAPVDFLDIPEEVTTDPGSVIDAEIGRPSVREDKPVKKAAKGTAPTAVEWQDFVGNILIRYATDWYLSWAFRGIDEEIVSDRDLERIRLRKEERSKIAEPLAEFASKSAIGKKHGRTLISAAGSLESLVTLGMWFSRVNRVASKYRPKGETNVNSRKAKRAREEEPTSPNVGGSYTIIRGKG